MIAFSPEHRAVLRDVEGFLSRVSDPDTRRRVLKRYLVTINGAPDEGYQYIAGVIEKELKRIDPPSSSGDMGKYAIAYLCSLLYLDLIGIVFSSPIDREKYGMDQGCE
ncbi:MAG: hypothetical protein A4E35_00129 [Methanoregula sp. PtaU1.Bin051]|nr:MAG: hypothetical protein A4E35_00129 [Methanoregula sp. PtaU1.Bin051]